MGEILSALKRQALDERTLVIFASDNGPFLSYGEHAGSAGALREGKLTTFEGGVRVPCIMRWPGQIPAGRECHEVCASIDLLPTVAGLVGAPLPKQRIDGRDIMPLIVGKAGAASPHEALFFYAGNSLQAVRSGDWKLHFPHEYLTAAGAPGRAGKPSNFENLRPDSIQQSGIRGIASRHGYAVKQLEMSLFNLKDDPGETSNVASQHPGVVRRLSALAEPIRADLGDDLTGRQGAHVRLAGGG